MATRVASRTRPGVVYLVDAEAGTCQCAGYTYRGRCAHLREGLAMTEATPKNIHEAIVAVYNEVGYVKKSRSKEGGVNYSFAGEAALIEALRPAMVENGIYVSVVGIADVRHEMYVTTKGSSMNRVSLQALVRFAHAPSETHIDVAAVGEGSDNGDKATAKALTGAYKYALRQTFCIETGDDPDKYASDDQERALSQQERREVLRGPANGQGGTMRPETQDPRPEGDEGPGNWKQLVALMGPQKLMKADVAPYVGETWTEAAVNEFFGMTKESAARVITKALEGKRAKEGVRV